MPKRKLLFVLSHLMRGGSQRFTYELLSTLDRDRFDVAVLTKWPPRPDEYYDVKLRELGIPVLRRLPIFLSHLWFTRRSWKRFRRPAEMLHRIACRLLMGRLLTRYDVINAIQIENYYLVQPLLRDNRRVITYLMSQAFQYNFNPYEDCDPGRGYRFTVFDETLPAEWKGTACENAETIDFPLSMNFAGKADLSAATRKEAPFRIGVFIRLSPERPMTGLFQALQHLRKSVDAEIWWYGRGTPALVEDELHARGIRNAIVFKGESTDIERTLREDGLSLAWMTSFGPTIGYATLEVAGFGFPTLCWNLVDRPAPAPLQSFHDPQKLAGETLRMLQNPEELRASGERLREWVEATYDIRPYTAALENTLLRLEETAS